MKKRLSFALPKIICPGIARAHDLRGKGRRNALGLVLGRRSCMWFSGTNSLFAKILRSNSHTGPNFRVPLLQKTHDAECERNCLDAPHRAKRLSIIMQQAMRQTTGYYTGYICKRQPVGRYQLRASARAMPYMVSKLREKSFGTQVAQVVNRPYSVLEGRG